MIIKTIKFKITDECYLSVYTNTNNHLFTKCVNDKEFDEIVQMYKKTLFNKSEKETINKHVNYFIEKPNFINRIISLIHNKFN